MQRTVLKRPCDYIDCQGMVDNTISTADLANICVRHNCNQMAENALDKVDVGKLAENALDRVDVGKVAENALDRVDVKKLAGSALDKVLVEENIQKIDIGRIIPLHVSIITGLIFTVLLTAAVIVIVRFVQGAKK